MRDVRFVVLHAPGPTWQHGLPIFQQEGIQAHIDHYRQWLVAGKLCLGGPFLDEHAGGMMIPAEGLTEAEVSAFALADPAVAAGLLRVAVRPWLIGMKP